MADLLGSLPEALADGRLDNDGPRAWAGSCSVEHGANDWASELEHGIVTFDIKFGAMRTANRFDDRGFLSFVTSE
ncbi:hypothetical protein BHE74_00002148 [Ensete ventricosum]|uniref:Uncharacterized protein n=1 Tax=Ensete ventricosum TaxID=4639 RepID=A0A426XYC0_ENSVE|nr:hypothetical protein B296_00049831 [Ensete ventricosum]RWW15666.1 hypothetical protein GW17_00020480 [Ensete ventricosum]RWW88955.1 hypothetical protein BHE74_00002148 [Ensete ventricosum]RZS24944.1 hypothetical protein BHM03_00058078 [Ensete ventricosum]